MVEKNHLVYLDRSSIDRLMSYEFVEYNNKILLQWLKNNYLDISAIRAKVKTKVVITTNIEKKESSIFYLSVIKENKFLKTKLLTENESDCEFYLKIYNFLNSDSKFSVKIENDSFHGGNVGAAIKVVNKDKYFVLCIADSDKQYQDSENGDTCKKAATTVLNLNNSPIPLDLYVAKVREKENLFPFKEYLKFCNPNVKLWVKAILTVADEEMLRYVDIKDGLVLEKDGVLIKHDKKWKSVYGNLIKYCQDRKLFSSINDKGHNYTGVNGIGKDILTTASESFFNKAKYKNLDGSTKIVKIFGDQIFILDEWKELAKKIFDYGCCLSEKTKLNA